MQPLFTIHAREYLVGNHIEKKFGKYVNVWIPSKDSGIDLLLTNKDNSRTVSIQVKFSKDFVETTMNNEFRTTLLASGWWTLSKEKIEKSEADFWIFVQHSFKTGNRSKKRVVLNFILLNVLSNFTQRIE